MFGRIRGRKGPWVSGALGHPKKVARKWAEQEEQGHLAVLSGAAGEAAGRGRHWAGWVRSQMSSESGRCLKP